MSTEWKMAPGNPTDEMVDAAMDAFYPTEYKDGALIGVVGWISENIRSQMRNAIQVALTVAPEAPKTFQDRVAPWMQECFGPRVSADVLERGDRLLEEVFELLQSGYYPVERVAALRDYVWSKPVGEPAQEVGGVMVTLAAYCIAHSLDMHEAGETELARISAPDVIAKIRAKQAAKPTGSALPVAAPEAPAPAPVVRVKPLEWVAETKDKARALTDIGTYVAWGDGGWHGPGAAGGVAPRNGNITTAKAAAQAHWEFCNWRPFDITPAPSPEAIAAAPNHVSEEMLDAAMHAYHGDAYDGRLRGCSAEVGEGAREEMRAAIAAALSLLKEGNTHNTPALSQAALDAAREEGLKEGYSKGVKAAVGAVTHFVVGERGESPLYIRNPMADECKDAILSLLKEGGR